MMEDYKSIPALFLAQVERLGSRVALRDKNFGIWDEISWTQYYRHVNYFALGMITLGVKRKDCLAILGENRPEWLYADLAIQSLGGMRAGIFPTSPSFEVSYYLKHSKCKIIVVEDQEQCDKVLAIETGDCPDLQYIIYIDPKGLKRYDDPRLKSFKEVQDLGRELDKKKPDLFKENIAQIEIDDIAIVVYTSGTTGAPKGAMWSHNNIIHAMIHLNEVFQLGKKDDLVSYLPLCHGAESILSMFIPMMVGTITSFAESINTVQDALSEISPALFFGVPRIWEKMHASTLMRIQKSSPLKKFIANKSMKIGGEIALKKWENKKINIGWRLLNFICYLLCFRKLKDDYGLLNARIIISATAPISHDILKFFHGIGVMIQEGYGQTETCGFNYFQSSDNYIVGSVGKSMPGIEGKLTEDGEILIRGKQTFSGYLYDPEATEKARIGEWVITGDVGRFDENGNLYIIDRKKDIIITAGGKNISPSEIEHRLKGSPFIREAVVIGDRRKFVSALLEIDYETMGDWATDNRIAFTTYKDLASNPLVREKIQEEVNFANSHFARVANIRNFRILPKQLDVDEEEVTATLKIKRKKIEAIYSDLIEGMYGR